MHRPQRADVVRQIKHMLVDDLQLNMKPDEPGRQPPLEDGLAPGFDRHRRADRPDRGPDSACSSMTRCWIRGCLPTFRPGRIRARVSYSQGQRHLSRSVTRVASREQKESLRCNALDIKRFMVLGSARTGSTLLLSLLSKHPHQDL